MPLITLDFPELLQEFFSYLRWANADFSFPGVIKEKMYLESGDDRPFNERFATNDIENSQILDLYGD